MRHSKPPAKLAMVVVLPLLLLCYGVGNVHCSTVHENSEDFRSLTDFKRGITDPNGALNNWTSITHFCRWNGVKCSSTPPYRVTELHLSEQGLGGQISSSLGNLTFLKALYLNNNSFVGAIPPLNNLQHLGTLVLSNNLLQGTIPDALTNCTNLAYLDLSMNNLTGEIPPSIGLLSKLVGFSFSKNNLAGVIPSAIGNITTLKVVDLSYNQLNGPIPNEFWHMPNIVILYLTANSLSGGIPQTLSNTSSSLEQLSLASNLLEDTLPSNIGDAFPNLSVLSLGGNNFHGQIPASLGNVTGLQKLGLEFNNLTGQVPSFFGRLPELSDLNLEHNVLEASDNEIWEFFHALANCSLLNRLSVSNNKLQGIIPSSIGNLSSNLTRLIMGGNNLSGIVPPSIGKFHSLVQLSLDSNGLSGTIEEWVGNLTKLQILNLQENLFTGTIPPSISNLSQLTSFSVAKNKFTGFIPPSLGNLPHVLVLNLSYNNFQGRIPVEFGSLGQLTKLDLSSNKIGGEIPESLGQCQQLLTIQLDQNVLTGNIPTTFCNLHSLNILNISHNDLMGSLPACLNGLTLLTELDLSYNNFQGEIPRNGVFDNATIVSLDGNPGLCGGSMGLHMRSCHVSRRARIANYLIKILIPIFGFMSIVVLVYFLVLEKKTTRGAHLAQPSFEHFEKVSYNDLAQATQNFSVSNMIGRGSYGSVYRGKLKESKMEVAVKVFNLEMRGAERSFLSECEALRSIQHRNLLPIITACSGLDNTGNVFKALVYELMPNGNLDTWLHHQGNKEEGKKRSLSLTQRISIVVNVADALDYLHHDCGRPTVHCDLKPSNILLDDDMNALLGDFGIARLYADPQSAWAGSVSSIGLKGTIGYIPPEYGGGGHASTSGDVYSFGIVLLEVLTNKRPTDPMFNDGLDIISFAENSFPGQIFNVIDVHLLEECKSLTQEKKVPENDIYQCLVALLQVALACTRPLPSERLNMKQVASKMHAIKSSYLGLKDKRLESKAPHSIE